MKKITLLFSALFVGSLMNAQVVTLSQSLDPSTIDEQGVACWSSTSGEYRMNTFARTYDLAGDFGITDGFEILAVEFGQSSADAGKTVDVNIHIADTENLPNAVLVLVASETVTLDPADNMTLITAPINAIIPPNSIVVVEIFAPDGGTATGQRFFPGFNLAGQLNTAWIMSNGCGLTNWTDSNDISAQVGPQEYVINLRGESILSVGDNTLSQISVFPNPAVDVINVNVPANVQISGAVLYDVLGKNTGASISNGQINVANLSRGVYMLSLETSAGTLVKKIVKQ